MKATLESKENNRAVLSVEVAEERFQQALDQAYKQVVKRLNIPGFRRGKAPRQIVNRYIGKESLLQQAAEDLLPEAYSAAVSETGIDPVSRPEIEIVTLEEGKAFCFKASVEVRPEVDLGDYRAIKGEREPVEISTDQIDEELEALRKQAGQLEVSEEPAALGDFVQIDFVGKLDGEPFEGGDAEGYLLELGSGTFVGDFEQQLVGLSAGEDRTIKVVFPDDYGAEHLAGKEVEFDVHVSEVKRRVLPELDDAFAQEQGAESLEELRQQIEDRLKRVAQQEVERKLERQLVDALVEQASMELHESMIRHQMEHKKEELKDQLQRQKIEWQEYLDHLGESEEELTQGLRDAAIVDLKTQLAIEALADAEEITVSQEEIDAEISITVAMYGEMGEAIRGYLTTPESVERISRSIRQRKTIARLKELATGWSGEPEVENDPTNVEEKEPRSLNNDETGPEGSAGDEADESVPASEAQ